MGSYDVASLGIWSCCLQAEELWASITKLPSCDWFLHFLYWLLGDIRLLLVVAWTMNFAKNGKTFLGYFPDTFTRKVQNVGKHCSLTVMLLIFYLLSQFKHLKLTQFSVFSYQYVWLMSDIGRNLRSAGGLIITSSKLTYNPVSNIFVYIILLMAEKETFQLWLFKQKEVINIYLLEFS